MRPALRDRLLGAAVAAVLVADLAVLALRDEPPTGAAAPRPSPSASRPASASPSPSRSPEAGLARYLATPAWPQLPDDIVGAGPIDLAKAAELDGDGAESRAFLQELGFRGGHLRSWGRVSQEVVLVTLLYEFATPANAKTFADGAFLARTETGKAGAADPARSTRTVVMPVDSDGDVLRFGIVVRGPRVAVVSLVTDDPAPGFALEQWRATTAAQYAAM